MDRNLELHRVVEGNFASHYPDNAPIYFKHYIPKEKKDFKYHVIVQHGMIEYHRRHENLYQSLMNIFKDDIAISMMDLLGHGYSGGDRAYLDKFDTYTRDQLQFFKVCHQRFYQENTPRTILISHSLGGLVSLKTVTNPELHLPFHIDGFIFTNPLIAPKLEIVKPLLRFVDHLPKTLAKVHVPLVYNAYDLTQDSDRAISFMHDHLISKSITLKLAVETLKATKNINSLSYFFKYPSLFILSGDDRLVDNEKTKLFITGMNKKLVEVKYYSNMRHDIMNETCRSDVFQDIINYIKNW